MIVAGEVSITGKTSIAVGDARGTGSQASFEDGHIDFNLGPHSLGISITPGEIRIEGAPITLAVEHLFIPATEVLRSVGSMGLGAAVYKGTEVDLMQTLASLIIQIDELRQRLDDAGVPQVPPSAIAALEQAAKGTRPPVDPVLGAQLAQKELGTP